MQKNKKWLTGIDVTNVLVTGCNGFVGSSLMDCLAKMPDVNATGLCRNEQHVALSDQKVLHVSDLTLLAQQHEILNQTDVVIHVAGKAHVLDVERDEDKDEYFHVNTRTSAALAKMAASAGVKRFIYISSTKVFGNPIASAGRFDWCSPTKPEDAYGESKLRAELELSSIARETGLELVIIRPPLVYGRGVKGNMARLTRLVRSNLPLPFKSLDTNKKSMVSIDNLIDLVTHCIISSDAEGQVFLVSDDHDLSTLQIICLFKRFLRSKSIVFFVPQRVLHGLGFVTGTAKQVSRLVETFEVDIEHTKNTLKWRPPQSVEEGFRKMLT